MAVYTDTTRCPSNSEALHGRIDSGTLTISGVSMGLDWDGAEEIPARDIDMTKLPKSSGIGSALYPDGIVALAKPDIAQETLHINIKDPPDEKDVDAF